ncbi:MAG: dihydroorotate dehydrogenase [Coriobacteriales bacterium]
MTKSDGGVSLAVDLGGLRMDNPVTVASGTFGAGREYADLMDITRLGAVVTKGVSPVPWEGNPSPRLVETSSGLINSIGLQNPGVEAFCAGDLAWLSSQDVPAVVNVCGHARDEYVAVIERLEQEPGVDAYEVNISCPNVENGGMTFGCDPEAAASVVAACRAATRRPLIVKLTPNVTDVTEIARAAESAGADALSLINSVLAMSVDAETRRPDIARVMGGLSGPAIKPIALRMVYQTYHSVSIPLLGIGGVSSGRDVVEFMLAGATAVAFGTALFANPTAPLAALDYLKDYCTRHGVSDVNELVGALDVADR